MKKSILVAGDSQDFQNIVKAIFSENRTLLCASSSGDVYGFLESRPVHLIIISVKFEQNPAFKFIAKLRSMEKRISEIPVVMLTNTVNPELSDASAKHDIYIVRLPVEPISFEADVNEIIIKNSKNYEKPDIVTGLIKKQYAEEQIAELLAEGKKGALLLISIDSYSFASAGINPESLLKCRDVIRETISKEAVLAVANKHSFILFVPELRERSDIEDYGTRIIESFNDKAAKKKVYVSIGLASTDRHGSDYTDLFQQCDLGLGLARSQGKNKACFYSW